MNKQEVIDELTKTQNEFFKIGSNIDLEQSTRNVAIGVTAGIGMAIKNVDRLDEPQKVKLPKAAEPWLKHAQYSTDVIDLFSAVEYATDSDGFISENWQWSGEFYDWLSEDADTLYLLCDALRYGYEIDKEPQWVVRRENGDYVENFIEATMDFEIELTSQLDSASPHSFTDKAKAEAVALLVDGSVEEV